MTNLKPLKTTCCETDGLRYIYYGGLGPSVFAASFERTGGVSQPPFDTLNTSFFVEDLSEDVDENHRRIKLITKAPLIMLNQMHGNAVTVLEEQQQLIKPCDGVITRLKNVALSICHADCQAALFFDPKTQVIAAAHAGWRGLCQNIYSKVTESMHENYASDPKDIRVIISPSLGPCHAEFMNWELEFPPLFSQFIDDRSHVDLWGAALAQLQLVGVQQKHIHIERLCTVCHRERFFSYRGEGKTGRNISLITFLGN